MKKRVLEMYVNKPAAQLRPEEKERSCIHLVTLPARPSRSAAPAGRLSRTIFEVNAAHPSVRRSKHLRESERISTLALAGAALIAPIVWMGHALLVWLDVL